MDACGKESEEYKVLNDAMIVTVQGISAGMNNTG